ncbi:sensor histidine kinase [Cribrihabitans neustonicus]|uniref:sensor histidine kinase n=1 Tax=Cribrihabitans neustonicus TaxID=1429085 RepID=UPI003B5B6F93
MATPPAAPGLDLAELAEDAPCGIVVTDPHGTLQYINKTFAGWIRPSAASGKTPGKLTALFTKAGQLFFDSHVLPMLHVQGYAREISLKLESCGGPAPMPILLNGKLRKDASGLPSRIDFTIFDARERQTYEEELRVAQRKADELAAIVRSSPNAILRADSLGNAVSCNRGAEELCGHPLETLRGKSLEELVVLRDEPRWFSDRTSRHGAEGVQVFEASHASGKTYEVTLARIDDKTFPAEAPHWSVVLRDITRQKAAERQLRYVAGEMRHRVKNTLAVVAAMTRQSVPEAYRGALMARFQSLSRAHDILISSQHDQVQFASIVELTSQEAGGPSKLRASGQDAVLTADQGTALCMALHELTTNALKYGALSVPDGYVELRYGPAGEQNGNLFQLSWKEHGGPAVTPPSSKGYGSRIISTMLKAALAADVALEFPVDGLSFRLTFELPATAHEPSSGSTGAAAV